MPKRRLHRFSVFQKIQPQEWSSWISQFMFPFLHKCYWYVLSLVCIQQEAKNIQNFLIQDIWQTQMSEICSLQTLRTTLGYFQMKFKWGSKSRTFNTMLSCKGVNAISVFVPTYRGKRHFLLTNCFAGRYWYEWTKILEILIIFNNFIDMILIMAWQQSVHEQEIISKPASTIKANLNMNEYIHH